MRIPNIFFLLLISACTEKPQFPHIADLPKFEGSSHEIQLFLEDNPIGSSDPLHNVVPPHGSKIKGKIHWKDWNKSRDCIEVEAVNICAENFKLNAGLLMTASKNGKELDSFRYEPTLTDILYRFIGAPSATLYTGTQFGNDRIGVLHSPTHFTLYRNGRFCKSIRTNPNHHLTFGIHVPSTRILLFSSGTGTQIDRPVDGWRVYDEALLCN